MKKKAAILISGNIRLFEENKEFYKRIFDHYECDVFASVWEDQENYENFIKIFKPKLIETQKRKNWEHEIEKIRYVTGEEGRSYTPKNCFNMWDSIINSIQLFQSYRKIDEYEIVCRYRSDLKLLNFPENYSFELKEKHILVPDCNHFRGVNDQIFFMKPQTILELKDLINYVKKLIENGSVFHPEYFLYRFISNRNFNIKIIKDFEYLQLGPKKHHMLELKPSKKAHIPFIDKFYMKKIKYFFKIQKLFK